jgi:YfiH family protein
MLAEPLCDPVLIASGFKHGFGHKGSQVPECTVFPVQVHGIEVLEATQRTGQCESQADAVFASSPGISVGVVTADCVPILVAARGDKPVVAAIHAGWRGLAAGVIEKGLDAVRSYSGGSELVAAVGPAARGCCYEVDAPVREGLEARYAAHLEEALIPTSQDHYQLDLPVLATRILESSGLGAASIGTAHRVCTICDPVRFESYRRDGNQAGRLSHFISL